MNDIASYPDNQSARRLYAAPELIEHGTLEELTQSPGLLSSKLVAG